MDPKEAVELYDDSGRCLEVCSRLLELSPRGARFASRRSYDVGRRVILRLQLRRGVMDVDAVVVWTQRREDATVCGLRFVERRPGRAPGSPSPSNPPAAS